MSEQASPKPSRRAPARMETPSPDLLARRKRPLAVYIGPDRPFGVPLRRNALLLGGPSPQLREALAAHPELGELLVPVEKLAEARSRLREKGSRLHGLFATINEAGRKARGKE